MALCELVLRPPDPRVNHYSVVYIVIQTITNKNTMLCFCATFFFPSSCTHDCTNLQISWNGSSTSKIKNANRPCCVCIEPAVNQNLSSTQDRNTRHHLLQRLQLLLHSFKVHKSREKMKFFQYFTLCYNYRGAPPPPPPPNANEILKESGTNTTRQ